MLVKRKLMTLPKLAGEMGVSYNSLRTLREKGLLQPSGWLGHAGTVALYTEDAALNAFRGNHAKTTCQSYTNKIDYTKFERRAI